MLWLGLGGITVGYILLDFVNDLDCVGLASCEMKRCALICLMRGGQVENLFPDLSFFLNFWEGIIKTSTLEERINLKPRAANCGSRSALMYTGGEYHVYGIRCKSWNCQRCAQTNADIWAHRVALQPCKRFLTLTQIGGSREEIRDAIKKLFYRIRKLGFQFEYWGAVELHKSGVPHWHSITHGDYLPPLVLKWCCQAEGIGHSDIRAIKSNLGMAYYCVKHLCHAHQRRWDGRQIRYSRRFFVNAPPPENEIENEIPKSWEVVFGRAQFVAQKLNELGYTATCHDAKPDVLWGETYDPDAAYKWRERSFQHGYGIFEWKSKGVKYYEDDTRVFEEKKLLPAGAGI